MLKVLVLTFSLLAIVGLAFVSADNEEKVAVVATDLTGKIIMVDADKSSITVRHNDGKEVIYVFDDSTTFYRDGAVIKVDTLKSDEMVTLKLSPEKKNVIVRLDTPVVEVKKED